MTDEKKPKSNPRPKSNKKPEEISTKTGFIVVALLLCFGTCTVLLHEPITPPSPSPEQQATRDREQSEADSERKAISLCKRAVEKAAEGSAVDFAWGTAYGVDMEDGVWWIHLPNTKVQNAFGVWITYKALCTVYPDDHIENFAMNQGVTQY